MEKIENEVLVIEVPGIIQKLETAIKQMVADYANFEVIDAETQKNAANIILESKSLSKKIDKERKVFLEPYEAPIKQVKNEVKCLVDIIDSLTASISKKYEVYTKEVEKKERERLEAEQIQKIKDAQENAKSVIDHIDNVMEETGIDLSSQKKDLANEAISQITELASEKINVKVTTRCEMGTVFNKKYYRAEVEDKIEFLKWVLKAHVAGVDRTGLFDISEGALNRMASEEQYKKLIDNAVNNTFKANGVKFYIHSGISAR